MVTYAPQPISVHLRQDQLDALQGIMEKRGITLDELIQQGVDAMLRTEINPETESVASPSLRGITGIFEAEPNDLSINHDKYLAEDIEAESHS